MWYEKGTTYKQENRGKVQRKDHQDFGSCFLPLGLSPSLRCYINPQVKQGWGQDVCPAAEGQWESGDAAGQWHETSKVTWSRENLPVAVAESEQVKHEGKVLVLHKCTSLQIMTKCYFHQLLDLGTKNYNDCICLTLLNYHDLVKKCLQPIDIEL